MQEKQKNQISSEIEETEIDMLSLPLQSSDAHA